MYKVLVFLAEGFEEVEALAVADVLMRAGARVRLVSVSESLQVKGAHGIEIKAGQCLRDVVQEEADILFLPGGMPGTTNLGNSKELKEMLFKQNQAGRRIAAICAAPSILGEMGLLQGKKATCYPGFEDALAGAVVVNEKVVTDGNITSSRGMGTAIDLGLALTKILFGSAKEQEVAGAIQYEL
ncbi:DJ-1 family glyoxalase III [Parasporobacterium paucivorans]|uniref:4-methyl-5(B-hydroxyethyl)-thiazole monophosphate biosynthesis n=1 Tax=Parasporobacterium paucivorans DSM 15970 TaxID=1122934 RepID=A0A1M6KDK0_9FIRM|nr:DJ-1 family glyoxalase III [Parasporobacterium paucivorans]SHJ57030.1 4-methyl-5(b-hydroxyethyl)-thiazole monophosphate biosynthesis [Parasporobacterium paucivorans DSM 15970]